MSRKEAVLSGGRVRASVDRPNDRSQTETSEDNSHERMNRAGRVPVVGLDLRPTEPGFKAHFGRGTGRYATELISALTKLVSAEGSSTGLRGGIPPIDLRPLGGSDLSPSEYEKRLVRRIPLGRMTIESQLLFPFRVRRCATDLVHFFHHGDAPAWCPVPYVITVLDLIPLKFAELYQTSAADWRYRLARWLELRSIRSARGILAISEATKRDLVEILNIAPEQVVVTRLAVGDQFHPGRRFNFDQPAGPEQLAEYQTELRRRLGIPLGRPILLYVGGIDQRKQVPFLFEVLKALLGCRSAAENRNRAGKQNAPEDPGAAPLLVLAGNYQHDKMYPQLTAAIAKLGLENHVQLTGFLPEDDLLDLYRAADLVLFPSLYEGFGFPVLEAISSGVPVLARSNSSIPEVVGFSAADSPVSGNGAVLLPDSSGAGVWADEIERLLSDTAARLELSAGGVKRARSFSWERTARETLFAYKQFSFGAKR